MNVDIKGDKEAVRKFCGADVEIVWRNCRFAKERGVHVEVTTLVIPTVNDDETTLRSIAKRIADELGQDTLGMSQPTIPHTFLMPRQRLSEPLKGLTGLDEKKA